ncbi:DUF1259 domain-containing protein [Bacillus subtilis]|uniref:DUF1259 domain-containing protein n=1 Tax=Bacillus subtilis TaxID=1423 RepID=UPI002E1C2777|nr:DUF1259 domain-containing protein [Bacillus subtilis]
MTITASHNHWLFSEPRVMHMHFESDRMILLHSPEKRLPHSEYYKNRQISGLTGALKESLFLSIFINQ